MSDICSNCDSSQGIFINGWGAWFLFLVLELIVFIFGFISGVFI